MDPFDLLGQGGTEAISPTQRALDATNLTLESVREQLTDALERLDRENLATLALWELIAERLGLTLEQSREGSFAPPRPGASSLPARVFSSSSFACPAPASGRCSSSKVASC